MKTTTEFAAMMKCRDALDGLPQAERNRVLHWLGMWAMAQDPQPDANSAYGRGLSQMRAGQ